MTDVVLELANPDEVVGVSPCCEGADVHRSVACNATYCGGCDTWLEAPKVLATTYGPTWRRDPQTGKFVQPLLSLGPIIVAWCHRYLRSPDGEGPFRFTPEQTRLLYWIYAVEEMEEGQLGPEDDVEDRVRWVYRELNIQRLKGWGKDPFAAALALIELCGPCRPVRNRDGSLALDEGGNLRGRRETAPWISIAAVAKSQTKNTMTMFGVLASPRLKRDYGVVVGKEQVVASGGGMIEAVTSAPATMEGNRPTFQIGNEPHHWKENNDGHAMRSVMDRNLKRKMSRILWITNAYNEADMSVGQSNREGWEMTQGDQATHVDTGVMYDSLEAPESARVVAREIEPVLQAVRGDSYWVDIPGIKSRMLDPRNSVVESRRFYYNQIGADEESWLDPKDVNATIDPQVQAWRADPEIDLSTKDARIRVGWAPVDRNDPVVLFFDGGKSGDHTAVSGYRISDGYLFAVGYWGRPENLDDRVPWYAPRDEVDARIIECVGWDGGGTRKAVEGRFNVVALWGDPSHAKDNEDDVPYWDGLLDQWHRRWKDQFLLWAVKTGDGQHSVKWDMTSPQRTQLFVQAAEEFVQEMKDRSLRHDGHPMFIRYMKNAKGMHTKFGTTLWKGARNSKRKIDGAVTHVGARMLGQLFLNREKQEDEKKKTGRVWGYR